MVVVRRDDSRAAGQGAHLMCALLRTFSNIPVRFFLAALACIRQPSVGNPLARRLNGGCLAWSPHLRSSPGHICLLYLPFHGLILLALALFSSVIISFRARSATMASRRRATKKGVSFCLMVVGASGTGACLCCFCDLLI